MQEQDYSTFPAWQRPAQDIGDYHACETTNGRQFIVRMNAGADPLVALANFAKKENIRFARIHTACHGSLQPTKYYTWIPGYKDANRYDQDLDNWNVEGAAVNHNIMMLCAVSGMISTRPDGKGGEEPFIAMHFINGGAWDSPVFGGHMLEGTRIKGCMQVFVTELLDIEKLVPVNTMGDDYKYPGNFYVNTKHKAGK